MRVDVLAQLDKSLICRGPGAEPVAVEESAEVFRSPWRSGQANGE